MKVQGFLLAYVTAKTLEHFDAEVYNVPGSISGHSLKYVFAALALYVLLVFYQQRNCYEDNIT